MEIEKSTRFITDPVVTEYVNRVGQNIVKNSDCKVPFTIKVIDSDEINAMALPGGFFYVNSGLILNADEEAELAGVMAHETAHVCAHHAVREQTRMNYAQLGTIPLIMMIGYGWTGYGIYEAMQFAVPMTFLKFSRDFEAQADYLGIQYMYRAGYDPQAFISFFEKVQALEKRKPGLVAKAFSDHPQTPDRILHSQEEIAKILPARDEYTVTTSEFDDVKARLARIENKRRLLDTKDKNKPSLRRASTTDDKQRTGRHQATTAATTVRPSTAAKIRINTRAALLPGHRTPPIFGGVFVLPHACKRLLRPSARIPIASALNSGVQFSQSPIIHACIRSLCCGTRSECWRSVHVHARPCLVVGSFAAVTLVVFSLAVGRSLALRIPLPAACRHARHRSAGSRGGSQPRRV